MGNNAQSGEKGYTIRLTKENKLGEGSYAEVYKIIKNDKKMVCAAKLFKVKPETMNQLERLGYLRELKILQ
jgi:serine/threonine protein kinase